jgi:hypothetical protein
MLYGLMIVEFFILFTPAPNSRLTQKSLPGGEGFNYIDLQNNQAASLTKGCFLICFVFLIACTNTKVVIKIISSKNIRSFPGIPQARVFTLRPVLSIPKKEMPCQTE